MLDALITSRVRVQILMRLFLAAGSRTYLRELVKTFDASPGHILTELAQLNAAGLIVRQKNGRQVDYRANTDHPLYPEIHSMVRKSLGIDRMLDVIVGRAKSLEAVYVEGEGLFGRGAHALELVCVGDVDLESFRGCVQGPTSGHRPCIHVYVVPGGTAAPLQALETAGARLVLWEAGQ